MKRSRTFLLSVLLGALLVGGGLPKSTVLAQSPMINQTKAWIGWKQGFIQEINGTTITMDQKGRVWTVEASNATLVRAYGAKCGIEEFAPGDRLLVKGTIYPSENKITATYIKNLSIQAYHGRFFGSVLSKGEGYFMLRSIARGDQKVLVGNGTKFYKRDGKTEMSFGDLKEGDLVRVTGIWRRPTRGRQSEIYNTSRVRDLSQK